MDKKAIKTALDKLRLDSKPRKFKQAIDLIINFKGLDLKKDKIEYFIDLHHDKGKKAKLCALVGPELYDQAKKVFDHALRSDEFANYAKDKRVAKKLAKQYDLFIAQANIMAPVASAFGRTFGPLGKMPNPKAGCVVPPTANLTQVYDKLQRVVVVRCLKNTIFQTRIALEDTDEEKVIDNILTILKGLETSLPNHENNLGRVFVKLTMGPVVEVV